jgi:hypothetical protein
MLVNRHARWNHWSRVQPQSRLTVTRRESSECWPCHSLTLCNIRYPRLKMNAGIHGQDAESRSGNHPIRSSPSLITLIGIIPLEGTLGRNEIWENCLLVGFSRYELIKLSVQVPLIVGLVRFGNLDPLSVGAALFVNLVVCHDHLRLQNTIKLLLHCLCMNCFWFMIPRHLSNLKQ